MTEPTPASHVAGTPDAPMLNAWGIVGHDRAVETIRRVIREGNLSHTYLVTGPDGVGKGTLARRLAQTLVSPTADDPTLPDLTTRAARQIEAGRARGHRAHRHRRPGGPVAKVCCSWRLRQE